MTAIPLTVVALMMPYVRERMLAIHTAAQENGTLITEEMTKVLVSSFVAALYEGVRCGLQDRDTLLQDPKVGEWLEGTLGESTAPEPSPATPDAPHSVDTPDIIRRAIQPLADEILAEFMAGVTRKNMPIDPEFEEHLRIVLRFAMATSSLRTLTWQKKFNADPEVRKFLKLVRRHKPQ